MTLSSADPVPRLAPGRLLGTGLLLGLGMIAAAWVWRGAPGDHIPANWFPAARWAAYVGLGALVGGIFTLAAWRLLDRVPALKRIELLLVSVLDMPALRYRHAALLGLVAGIPEEILFRGAMQPAFGLVLTSLCFGVLHGITRAYFVYATLAGMMLGALAVWSDGLWASIAAHTVIDAVMLALLIRSWRDDQTRHSHNTSNPLDTNEPNPLSGPG